MPYSGCTISVREPYIEYRTCIGLHTENHQLRGADNEIFQEQYVNTEAVGTLTPGITRPSAVIILTNYDSWFPVLHEDTFPQYDSFSLNKFSATVVKYMVNLLTDHFILTTERHF